MFLLDYKCVENVIISNQSSLSNWIAIIVSIVAIILSGYFMIYTRKKDIEYEKFQNLVINTLNEHFEKIEWYLDHRKEYSLKEITPNITNLTLHITILKSEYNNINEKKLNDIIDEFSDFIYDTESNKNDTLHKYNKMKFEIFNHFYSYAIKDNRFYRLKQKKLHKNLFLV